MKKTKKGKKTMAVQAYLLMLLLFLPMSGNAQRVLTLDSCREMALRNNKQMSVAAIKQEVVENKRKSARTKYLPQVNALGTFQHTSKAVSLLNDEQKGSLSQMGTAIGEGMKQNMAGTIAQLPPQTIQAMGQMGLSPEVIGAMAGQTIDGLAAKLNGVGQGLVDALDLDTKNMWVGAINVTQPLYMGGAITAVNKMADIEVEMAANSLEMKRQSTLYNIDQAYWQVVSLRHKQKLAESFVALVKKLNSDVQKMINQGVATKGDGLSVSVRVNEAEMALTQVTDGLALSKMLLCQLCGLPVNENITLADEESVELKVENENTTPNADPTLAMQNRPELKVLQNTIDLSRQATDLLKAGNLPQVLLTGGYTVMNPNFFNGVEKKFGGFWNVGVTVRVPVWNWGDTKYKVRASKGASAIANLELNEARDLIELQVNQSNFKVNEAQKKLIMAHANVANADENLRMANLAFKEGTASFTTVMEAQTAWQQAQTQKIDAEIGLKLSQVELQKALGTLQ